MKRRTFLAACATAIASTPAIAFAEETQAIDPADALNALGSNPSYEEFVDYAERYLTDMDDPQHMSLGANNEPSTYAGSNPYWSSSNKGAKTFYDGNGNIWLTSAHIIVDVSSWQEDINWNATSQAVDGAVLRIGYGVGNTDRKFERNVCIIRDHRSYTCPRSSSPRTSSSPAAAASSGRTSSITWCASTPACA